MVNEISMNKWQLSWNDLWPVNKDPVSLRRDVYMHIINNCYWNMEVKNYLGPFY